MQLARSFLYHHIVSLEGPKDFGLFQHDCASTQINGVLPQMSIFSHKTLVLFFIFIPRAIYFIA